MEKTYIKYVYIDLLHRKRSVCFYPNEKLNIYYKPFEWIEAPIGGILVYEHERAQCPVFDVTYIEKWEVAVQDELRLPIYFDDRLTWDQYEKDLIKLWELAQKSNSRDKQRQFVMDLFGTYRKQLCPNARAFKKVRLIAKIW